MCLRGRGGIYMKAMEEIITDTANINSPIKIASLVSSFFKFNGSSELVKKIKDMKAL